LFVSALWFASLPAAHGLLQVAELACRCTGRWGGAAVTVGLLGAAGFAAQDTMGNLDVRCLGTTPLAIGLSTEAQAVIEAITSHTTPEARILWEDCCVSPRASHWSALLPVLTDRAYLGGLDANACIEHAYAAFVEQ